MEIPAPLAPGLFPMGEMREGIGASWRQISNEREEGWNEREE